MSPPPADLVMKRDLSLILPNILGAYCTAFRTGLTGFLAGPLYCPCSTGQPLTRKTGLVQVLQNSNRGFRNLSVLHTRDTSCSTVWVPQVIGSESFSPPLVSTVS